MGRVPAALEANLGYSLSLFCYLVCNPQIAHCRQKLFIGKPLLQLASHHWSESQPKNFASSLSRGCLYTEDIYRELTGKKCMVSQSLRILHLQEHLVVDD
jgi:hypothetical protein